MLINLAKAIILAILVGSTIIFPSQAFDTAEEQNAAIKPWAELNADPQYSAGQSMRFYNLKTENGSQAALVVLDLNDRNFEVLPFFCEHTTSPSDIARKEKALAAVNGGFFNLSNGESTSYVVINGKSQCEPKNNKALMENPTLKPYLETIFNRSELRILANKEGKRKAFIMPHNAPIPDGWTLLHSLQAGPMLVPTLTDTEEAFVRKTDKGKIVDSIGSNKQAARTAVGVTHDNHILLLCVASKGQAEYSSGVTLAQLAKTMSDLGCSQAINLDGGTSTTMVVAEGNFRDAGSYLINKVVSGNQEKMVKSGLMILKTAGKSKCPYQMPN